MQVETGESPSTRYACTDETVTLTTWLRYSVGVANP
jgi:hypothetical protein